ncbi:hypothetical protein APHAL10511_008509 [Amanita phalloides]|nr:hypothetical protein APHAL10511_008509 [Amanita phalloides]
MSTVRRVAIVTGAASGIGRAIALRLANDGFNLGLNDLPSSTVKLRQVADKASKVGIKAILVPGDVSSEEDVKGLVNATVNQLGGVDAMVANAGIANFCPFTELTSEQWDRTLAVHARGAFLCYKYAVHQMIKQGRGGRIIGASSIYGKISGPYAANYCAAKFAIRGLTQAVAQEVGIHGITVNAYAPGVISTPLIDALPDDMKSDLVGRASNEAAVKRLGQPEDVANVVSFLASENSDFIIGQTFSVNGGWHVFD